MEKKNQKSFFLSLEKKSKEKEIASRFRQNQKSLIYAFVSRGSVILSEYTEFSGNFNSIAFQCLQKLPAYNNKFTYNWDGHTFNYLVDNGYTYCVVADETVGRQVPVAFLECVKDAFVAKYGGGKASTAAPNSLNKEFGPTLKEYMQYCVDHPEEVSKLSKAQDQVVSDVKGVMMENIEKIRLEEMKSLTDLGLSSELAKKCETRRPWYFAMKFQREVIPAALQGNDVFGISPPGSGKTVAFVLPISHALLETRPNLTPFFALVLYSTRRLAFHTADHFQNLGSQFGVKCAIIAQENRKEHESILNSEQPHIIVGRPDLILYHLKHTRGFSLALASLKYLVIDDAHLLSYENILRDILEISKMIPSERRTFLFSSTFTEEVRTMLSVCLRNPVTIDLSTKYPIADTLQQSCFVQIKSHKDCYLVYTLARMTGSTSMVLVYTQQCGTTLRLALFLNCLGFRAIPIIRYMSQAKKLESLNAFKSGPFNILLCSDFLSKGLDIPAVDMVINYDIPRYPKDYIYRVGWTAAHVNVAISFVSPDERRHFNMIEKHIGKKLPLYPAPFEEVMLLEERAIQAESLVKEEMKEFGWMSGGYLESEEVPRKSSGVRFS